MQPNKRTVIEEKSLSTLFFRNPHLLVLSLIILLIAGASALTSLPRIEDPRITNRNPLILTMLPGASAARVEALVTKPLEDELREIAEIKEIESTSRPGISVISVELADWVDSSGNKEVFSRIRDRLADARPVLPAAASQPVFDDKRGAVAYSLIAAVRWQGQDPAQLGVMSRLSKELGDRLRNLTGTENVRVFGLPQEEVTVTVDPAELAALGLDITQASRRITAADVKVPAGVLRSAERDLLIEIQGELDSVRRIEAIPLASNDNGSLIRLGDIASVERRWQTPASSVASADGARAVFIAAKVDPQIRVDQWAVAARETVARLAAEFSGSVDIEVAFDQSRYTEKRLADLGGNLLAGAAVVMLVVLLGMGWRAALVVGVALPLSASFAVFGLSLFGQQIHQMTIFGMIIAVGLLIDNAIVMTDEVRKQVSRGHTRLQATYKAVHHLFAPLFASTLTTILGFMPIFLLPGNVGDFVGPIAISVVLALIGSFVLSMTLIAALAGRFVRVDQNEPSSRYRWWRYGINNPRLAARYRRGLLAAVQRPKATVAVVVTLALIGFGLSATLGNQFFPPADRDQFEVEVRLPSGSSVQRSAELSDQIEQLLRQYDGIVRVDWLAGGSFPSVYYNLVMDQDNDGAYAHAIVVGDSVARVNALIPRLQAELDQRFPEAQILVSPFGQGPPYEAPVAFRIVGPNSDELRRYGDELRRIMHRQPSMLHTRATLTGGEPKLRFRASEELASLAGLTLTDIATQFQTNLEGHIGGSVLEDLEQLMVRIRYADSERSSLERMRTLNLVSASSAAEQSWIPAEAVGSFELRPELASITRRNGERVNKVLGYVTQGTLPIDVTRAILEQWQSSPIQLAPGYRLEVAGDSEEQSRAVAQLATYVPVLAALMIATVVLSFRSAILASIIATVAALSVGFGMLSLWVSGYPLGFNPILGTAGLVGVAINGTIVVLAAIRANDGARAGDLQAIVAETVGTTRHILSTTLTTISGFAPLLVFSRGNFWPPLAVVIAGGVGLSALLSLLFTPAVYYWFHRLGVQTATDQAAIATPISIRS